jgi:hypothetical protein
MKRNLKSNMAAAWKAAAATALLFGALFPASISVKAAEPQSECTAQEAGGPIWVTAYCVDPLYNQPIIDSETDLTLPVPHRKVSGHFVGTDKRFNFYFPLKSQWEGRFYQLVYPLFDENAFDATIGFGVDSGAYTVQTNGGGGYRVDAAAAKFAKTIAAEYYGTSDPIYGYIYGGSGGSYQTIGAIENSSGVWDGAVPFIPGVPTSIPNNFFARAFAGFVLGDKATKIADAVSPGGSGDPFAVLNDMEKQVLQEVTSLGVPLRGWEDYEYLLGLNSEDGLLGFGGTIRMIDSTYMDDFWNKPGYLGTEQSSLGDMFRSFKVDQLTTITQITRNEQHIPTSLTLDSAPAALTRAGTDYTLYAADGTTKLGSLSGSLDLATKVFTIGDGNAASVLDALDEGAKLHIDNRWSLALLAYHRHQLPNRQGFYAWDHLKASDGTPLYPQRPLEIGAMISRSVTGGGTHNGHIQGKVIVVANLLDVDAYPWHADWYSARVKEYLGEDYEDNFRLWYNDNADHINYGARTHRLVQYDGIYEQALRDLSAWVEQGVAPAKSTGYDIVDSQVKLANDIQERNGIQPVVNLQANGTTQIHIKAGQAVAFTGTAAVPSNLGKIVSAAWDFEGKGNFTALPSLATPAASITETAYYTYTKPGTYFPAWKVTAQHEGDAETAFARVENLGRVRVVVEEADASQGETGPSGSIQDNINVSNGQIKIKPTLNEHGKATVKLSSEMIKSVLAQATGNKLQIRVEATEKMNAIDIELPLDKLAGQENPFIDAIEIDAGWATVTIAKKLIAEHSAAAGNMKLSVVKANQSGLPAGLQALFNESAVYDFSLSLDGEPITKFAGRTDVQVALPYVLKSGEQPNKVVIYSINENGKLAIVTNGKFNAATGKVEFKPKRLGDVRSGIGRSKFCRCNESMGQGIH